MRFRKLIECPAADPPLMVTVEISYKLSPVTVPCYDGPDDIFMGVEDWRLVVVAVQGPIGQYHQPSAFEDAAQAIALMPGIDDQIRDWCCQDYAERELGKDRLTKTDLAEKSPAG